MGKSTQFAIDFTYDSVRRMPKSSSQSDKFKEAARELGADEDEKHWEERLRKIAKKQPSERP